MDQLKLLLQRLPYRNPLAKNRLYGIIHATFLLAVSPEKSTA